jgi:hypothetical protein
LVTTLLCVVLALAGCAGNARPQRASQALAAAYMAIARPANHRLEVAVDSYNRLSHTNLAWAEADLRDEAATESWFDQRLLKIAFPPAIGAVARALVSANNERISLTKLQSRASTIAQMLALNKRHRAADAAVEAQVRIIRKDLGLPPPENS